VSSNSKRGATVGFGNQHATEHNGTVLAEIQFHHEINKRIGFA